MNVATVKNQKPTPYRCRNCRKHFSVRTRMTAHGEDDA